MLCVLDCVVCFPFKTGSDILLVFGDYLSSYANGRRQTVKDIRSHLICDGIVPTYTKWI